MNAHQLNRLDTGRSVNGVYERFHCNADGGGGVNIFQGKSYEGVSFNVINVTRGGSNFQKKKRYATLEWPFSTCVHTSA